MTSAPSKVGNYRILRRLPARGREIYLAQAEGDSTKHLLGMYELDVQTWLRLRRDVHRARKIDDPAIVPVRELLSEGSTRMVVMELVEGVTVRQLVDQLTSDSERLADGAVFEIGRQLMLAAASAHELRDGAEVRPVVHGSLEPRSLYLDWNGALRVVGFGMAALCSAERQQNAYLAPEVYRGGAPSLRSDVFSAALVLWSLLAGREPVDAAEREPLALLRPDLDGELTAAIELALEPRAKARTITCRALGELVQPLADRAELAWNLELMRALLPLDGSLSGAEAFPLSDAEPSLEPPASSDDSPTQILDRAMVRLGKAQRDSDDSPLGVDSEPPSDEQPTHIHTLPDADSSQPTPRKRARATAPSAAAHILKTPRETPAARNSRRRPTMVGIGARELQTEASVMGASSPEPPQAPPATDEPQPVTDVPRAVDRVDGGALKRTTLRSTPALNEADAESSIPTSPAQAALVDASDDTREALQAPQAESPPITSAPQLRHGDREPSLPPTITTPLAEAAPAPRWRPAAVVAITAGGAFALGAIVMQLAAAPAPSEPPPTDGGSTAEPAPSNSGGAAVASQVAAVGSSSRFTADASTLPLDRGLLTVSPAVAGIDVLIDEQRVGGLGTPLVVPCGRVSIHLSAKDGSGGWQTRPRLMSLACRQHNRLSLDLGTGMSASPTGVRPR